MSGGPYGVSIDGTRIGTIIKLMGEPVKHRWVAWSVYRLPGDQDNTGKFRTAKQAMAWIKEQHRAAVSAEMEKVK